MVEDVFGVSYNPNSATIISETQPTHTVYYADRDQGTLFVKAVKSEEVVNEASYSSNHRVIHAHFDNIFFDGIKTIHIKVGDTTYNKQLTDKSVMAKEFKVEDVMNFPVDLRSPLCAIVEDETKFGQNDSQWYFHIKF